MITASQRGRSNVALAFERPRCDAIIMLLQSVKVESEARIDVLNSSEGGMQTVWQGRSQCEVWLEQLWGV